MKSKLKSVSQKIKELGGIVANRLSSALKRSPEVLRKPNFIHNITVEDKSVILDKNTSHSDDIGVDIQSITEYESAPDSKKAEEKIDAVQTKYHPDPIKQPSRVYLDYASLTPLDPRVDKVMRDSADLAQANPSSLYKEGIMAKKTLHDARVSVSHFFGVQPDEVIFTSGGTEANNIALQGIAKYESSDLHISKPHIIISTIEHPSIVEIALEYTNMGYDVSFIPVSPDGLVDSKDIRKALRPDTILVSIMYVNNEIGTIQPIKEIAREIRHFKKSLNRGPQEYPYFHTDACQAVLYEDMHLSHLGVDLMTIDSAKLYGPRGIGALIKRRYVNIKPLYFGGSQEQGIRPGTEHVTAIIGFKHALDITHSEKEETSLRMLQYRDMFSELLMPKLKQILPSASINGDMEKRVPNNLNVCLPGIDAEFLVIRLDALGLAVSSVTSCRAHNEDSSSYVVEALGKSDCASSSLRCTWGRFTTAEDINRAVDLIVKAVSEQASPRNPR